MSFLILLCLFTLFPEFYFANSLSFLAFFTTGEIIPPQCKIQNQGYRNLQDSLQRQQGQSNRQGDPAGPKGQRILPRG